MIDARACLRAVAAAHAAGAGARSAGGISVCRVAGGANNALYRVEVDGVCCAVKLCVADGRRRAAREYAALQLLHVAGLDLAPQPLGLDESCSLVPFPAVIYRWLPGESVTVLSAEQRAALLDGYHAIHALRRSDYGEGEFFSAWFHWFDFGLYLDELNGFLADYGGWLAADPPDGQQLRDRLARLVEHCAGVLSTTGADPSRERVPLCLCRVDPNLANGIWGQDRRLRWVDWEYSGWGDPALDLAELRWHAALDGQAQAQCWLREHYRRPPDDPDFEERLRVWDHVLATRWPFLVLRILWSVYNGPDRLRLTRPDVDPAALRGRLVSFIERAEHLF